MIFTNNYRIIISWNEDKNMYIAEIPELPGCMAEGKTYQNALSNVEVIMQEFIEEAANEYNHPKLKPIVQLVKKKIVYILFIIFIIQLVTITILLVNGNHLKKENQVLIEKFNVSKFKVKLSKTLDLLKEYKSGEPELIVMSINDLNLNKNMSRINEIYGENSGTIINIFENIINEYSDYISYISKVTASSEVVKGNIRNTENNLAQIKDMDIKYRNFIIEKKFDIDYLTGQGYYEALIVDNFYQKVVVIAFEKEIKIEYYGQIVKLLVSNKGELPITVTKYNMYQQYDVTEYYKHFEVIDSSLNPFLIKKEFKRLKNEYNVMKKEFEKRKATLLKDLESNIKTSIKNILDISTQ
jgi:predicted RNase H-like HicB family nuclease